MKFYDREVELGTLRKNQEMSMKSSTFTVITGRRRIGKTSLILESLKGCDYLYFQAPRGSASAICEQLVEDAREGLGIELLNTGRFRDLFKQLMQHGEKNGFTFIIDEFQELEKADGSTMSGIQNIWDLNKGRTRVNLIVCGSIYSMMIKIFQNSREPLFGRATSKFNVEPFRPSVVKAILKDHNPCYEPDDLLLLYMVTGGVPKYVESLMDAGATRFDDMLDAVCTHDSLFITEGMDLLVLEFGKEYGMYFSILRMIALGKNTLREISDAVGTEAGAHLDRLEKEYRLVRKSRPMFSAGNSRDIRWKISDNYLDFYFRFIHSGISIVGEKRYDKLRERICRDYAQYSGRVLEDYFIAKLSEEEDLTGIGSYWDRKGQNEIDIIAVDDMSKRAIVTEVKRDPKRADISKLKEKAGTVHGLKEYDVEYRALSLDDM